MNGFVRNLFFFPLLLRSGLALALLLTGALAQAQIFQGTTGDIPDDECPDLTPFTADVTYYVYVDGADGATGNYELTYTCHPVPEAVCQDFGLILGPLGEGLFILLISTGAARRGMRPSR